MRSRSSTRAVAGSPDYTALAADLDGQFTGWICWGPTPCTVGTYDLYWMAVDPVLQGLGFGSALLEGDGASDRGLGPAHHGRDVRPARYLPTRAFYEARGYRGWWGIPEFYAPGDDQVVYVKR